MHIQQLIEQFENCTLPKEEWTHKAHIQVALYYLFYNDFYIALSKVRCGIIRYNSAVEDKNLCSDKYHETITVFWCIKIQEFIDSCTTETLEEIEEKVFKTSLKNSGFIRLYYSAELLRTAKLGAQFQRTPDVKLP